MKKLIYDTRQLPLTLNVAEAAQLMRTTQPHVRMLLREKKLNGRKVGKGWSIPKKELLKYINVEEDVAS